MVGQKSTGWKRERKRGRQRTRKIKKVIQIITHKPGGESSQKKFFLNPPFLNNPTAQNEKFSTYTCFVCVFQPRRDVHTL